MVSFMPQPFYPRENSPRYPMDRWLGGPQSPWGSYEEEKNPLPGIELRFLAYLARSLVPIPLSYPGSLGKQIREENYMNREQ
jgi:hypothetical protein